MLIEGHTNRFTARYRLDTMSLRPTAGVNVQKVLAPAGNRTAVAHLAVSKNLTGQNKTKTVPV